MSSSEAPVELAVYDLSQGMARSLSLQVSMTMSAAERGREVMFDWFVVWRMLGMLL